MGLEQLGRSKSQKLNIVWFLETLYNDLEDKFNSTELKILKWWQTGSYNDQDCLLLGTVTCSDTCVCVIQR